MPRTYLIALAFVTASLLTLVAASPAALATPMPSATAAAPPAASATPALHVAATPCAKFYIVRTGDRLARIARRFRTTVSALVSLNHLSNANRIFVAQALCVRAGPFSGFAYVVRSGDTLHSIGRRFGWQASFLASVNGLKHANRIFVGQVLLIPNH